MVSVGGAPSPVITQVSATSLAISNAHHAEATEILAVGKRRNASVPRGSSGIHGTIATRVASVEWVAARHYGQEAEDETTPAPAP